MSHSTSAKVCAAVAVFGLVIILFESQNGYRYTIQVFQFMQNEPAYTSDHPFGFASYYQDNMVLQAAPYRAVIWGYGSVGARVAVTLNAKKTYDTVVKKTIDGIGVWSVTFDPQPPGTRGVISASHTSLDVRIRLTSISNVVFGDVWVCSGQSNMVFPMGHVYNASEELADVSKYSDIRIFTVSQETSDTPLYDLKGIEQNWAQPTPDNVQYFSAVCWLYARNLYDKLKVPFGLVQTDWGGTPVEAWSSPKSLEACGLQSSTVRRCWHCSDLFQNLDVPHDNSVLWNAMVHPLLNMTITGAIWYQGEANANYNRDLYNCTFPNMIKHWRLSWYEGTDHQTNQVFPFGFVQLSTKTIAEDGYTPLIRWHQTADRGYVPNSAMPGTFMAVSLDLPDPDSPYGSIHPRDKQDVGLRLATAALSHAYKVEPAEDGPIPNFTYPAIDTVVLGYTATLNILDDAASNFEVCCADSKCDVSNVTQQGMAEWKPSKINDYGTTTVQITGDSCPQGVKRVRYAWATMPCVFKKCQIYNEKGFPAPPFVIDVTGK